MRGAEEMSSQPSAPTPLIQASNPLTIPPSPSAKMTIRSKYSHCMISLPSAPETSRLSAAAIRFANGGRESLNRSRVPAGIFQSSRNAATRYFSAARQVLGQPRGGGLAGRGIEAELAVVEPARKETDQAVFVLQIRADA